jgi:putative transposase
MNRSRFIEEQIIGVLKEAEAGAKTADLAWSTRRIGRDTLQLEGQVRRPRSIRGKHLRAMEDENGRLKRLLADAMLDNAGLKDLLSKK